MGYDLTNNEGDYFRANVGAWGFLLDTAQKHGWKPAGTLAPEYMTSEAERAAWDGDYCSNDYQRVSDDDARNMAAALRKALRADEFSHEDEWYVRHFVAYCQNGSFEIG